MDDELFQPSLSNDQPAQPLYSALACWMTAFFGGPIAALLIFGANFKRAGLLPSQARWLVLASALAIAAIGYTMQEFANRGEFASDSRLQLRIAALVIAGLLYWRLRRSFRAQEMFGITPAQPWAMAFGAIALNIVVIAGLTLMLTRTG